MSTVTRPEQGRLPARERLRGAHPVGLLAATLAIGAALVAACLTVNNLIFLARTTEVSGEVVRVEMVTDGQGRLKVPLQADLTVEYADRKGQYRRFDEVWTGAEIPRRGDDLRVRYRLAEPWQARIAVQLHIWGSTAWVAAGALGAGLAAEELLRRRPRRRR